ncbi:hypothetical protein CH367_18805 [Leptospira barantonii]|uniref:Lipoprotein n=1 Tax=Leptospira barantonii TaxID=2023184 RepID=A0ABX4NKN8_9LEPT|nr:hypothetical protein CH367_18805 [Leptospira barantonii]
MIIKRIATILLISFFSLQCYLHQANVNGDALGTHRFFHKSKNPFIGSVPIRIHFDPNEKDTAIQDLRRKGLNVSVSNDDVESYYSTEILSQFRKSPLFILNPNAEILLRIKSSVEDVKPPVLSILPFIGTVGLFPMIESTNGRVEFELYDEKKNQVIRTYKYAVDHRSFFGIAPLFFGPILPALTDRFDHSQNKKTFSIMRVAFQQFEKDLKNDLGQAPELTSRFIQGEPHHFAFVSMGKTGDPGYEIFSELYTSIESIFLRHGLSLVERNRLNPVIAEIQLSLSGLTESSRLQLGKLLNADRLILMDDFDYVQGPQSSSSKDGKIAFSLRCLEVQTGRILWSERVEKSLYLNWKEYGSYMKEDLLSKLISSLRNRGELL